MTRDDEIKQKVATIIDEAVGENKKNPPAALGLGRVRLRSHIDRLDCFCVISEHFPARDSTERPPG